jgi:hypothetical protein
VQVWVNTDEPKNLVKIISTLDKAIVVNKAKEFVAFVIFVNPKGESAETIAPALEKIAKEAKSENVALTYVSGPGDRAIRKYGINTDAKVKNTVFVYKNKKASVKFVNLVADEKGIAALDKAISEVVE